MNAPMITGIHHVTAITSNAQRNLDFYAGILGLKLVKKTVNFEAPEVYHFYFGDAEGTPGSLLTFFPYEGLVNGRQGKGMLNTTGFSVPFASIDYWQKRLKRFGVPFKKLQERFPNEVAMYFEDEDGLGLELVFNESDSREGFTTGIVPIEHSIRGLHGVEIWEDSIERTAALLTEQMDHQLIAEKGNHLRLAARNAPGNFIDLLSTTDRMKGLAGSGTVHHIAFATPDLHSQEKLRSRLVTRNLETTPLLNRKYFHSIYFREPGGVLFEIATEGPGFGVDETAALLGTALQLPSGLEQERDKIVSQLPVVQFHPEKFI